MPKLLNLIHEMHTAEVKIDWARTEEQKASDAMAAAYDGFAAAMTRVGVNKAVIAQARDGQTCVYLMTRGGLVCMPAVYAFETEVPGAPEPGPTPDTHPDGQARPPAPNGRPCNGKPGCPSNRSVNEFLIGGTSPLNGPALGR